MFVLVQSCVLICALKFISQFMINKMNKKCFLNVQFFIYLFLIELPVFLNKCYDAIVSILCCHWHFYFLMDFLLLLSFIIIYTIYSNVPPLGGGYFSIRLFSLLFAFRFKFKKDTDQQYSNCHTPIILLTPSILLL